MRRIIIIIVALCLLITACAPKGNVPTKEMQGDLEFFILHDLMGEPGGGLPDLKDFAEVFGMFGGSMYVPKRYAVKLNEFGEVNGTEDLPREHVLYTVTGYPDVIDSNQYATGISITDPAVHVFGITTEASGEEFMAAVKQFGLKEATPEDMDAGTIARLDYARAAAPDGTWFVGISNADGVRTIWFNAPTTNEWGVMF